MFFSNQTIRSHSNICSGRGEEKSTVSMTRPKASSLLGIKVSGQCPKESSTCETVRVQGSVSALTLILLGVLDHSDPSKTFGLL